MFSKPPSSSIFRILDTLCSLYPEKGMVDMGNPEDTLIATLLSARTTDVQVLKAYPGFRKAFPTLESLANARVSDIGKPISTIGLWTAKAKAIKGLARRLLDVYGGRVPRNMEDLVTLPGVGRKTASCVLWYGYRIPAVAVDTHVFRVTSRLGWAKGKTAERVEEELKEIVPEKRWGDVNRSVVQFGRDICKAQKPQCWRCPIRKECPFTPKTAKP